MAALSGVSKTTQMFQCPDDMIGAAKARNARRRRP